MLSTNTSIYLFADNFSIAEVKAAAQKIEEAGYSAMWIPEAFGREAFTLASCLLENTDKLKIGTSIANIYGRDPRATRSVQMGLAEQSDNRFILGLGISHPEIVTAMRGHEYSKPVATMRAYLEELNRQDYMAPMPSQPPRTLIAALRPRMLALAAELSDGAILYATTPEHVARARQILGPDKQNIAMLVTVLETDPAKGRAAARTHVGGALALPNYQNSLKELGYTSDDFENGCSDRLMDALVAWGDERMIRKRIDELLAAGADHVILMPVLAEPRTMLDADMKLVELLAPNKA